MVFFLGHGYAQIAESPIIIPPKEVTPLNKNSIYTNVSPLLLYVGTNINYERILKQGLWNSSVSVVSKIGVGTFSSWVTSGIYSLAQVGLLTGKRKHHLELSAGINVFHPGIESYGGKIYFSDDRVGDPAPGHPFSGNIGWRFQPPKTSNRKFNFLFRAGIGLPDLAYIGIGFAFL